MLGECGLNTADLLLMDKVFTKARATGSTLKLVLVDHNEMSGQWHRKYPDVKFKVISIIDHHDDAGLFKDASPRIISTCGSTASLIHKHADSVDDEQVRRRLEDLTLPILRTVIYDTVNLTWRQRPIDEQVVEELGRKFAHSIATDPKSIGRQVMTELEEAIESAPETDFTTFELLYKDYKLYRHQSDSGNMFYYGISVLHLPFEQLLGSDHERLQSWTDQARRFMKAEELDILLMNNSIRSKGETAYYQQLAIFVLPKYVGLVDKIRDMLQANGAGLSKVASGEDFGLYEQADYLITRKRLHPLAKTFFIREFP